MPTPCFDLASLAKPLVTAPLAHAFLDLDADRRFALGFHDRARPLTVRQLLSHTAGLPPWLPFTGEPLAAQLRRGFPTGEHPLLAEPSPEGSTYSDLGYRLLAELLEVETGIPWGRLGAAATGLLPAPWIDPPPLPPPGPDAQAWALATEAHFPEPDPRLPHDANARAGMAGHAGFGTAPAPLEAWLRRWVGAGWPRRMAVAAGPAVGGVQWGLGLQRAFLGGGRFGELLARIPEGRGGIHVLASETCALPPPAPALEPAAAPTDFWFHLAFTGPALFVRPSDGCCLALLCRRLGPDGGLLAPDSLRARRWELLEAAVRGL